MAIRNIIFDLGGVFIDIHYHLSKQAFEALGVPDFDSLFQQTYSNPLFSMLETGEVSTGAFYDALRKETGLNCPNSTIESAWNAMLGDFRLSSIAVLPDLKQQYQIFLLSNTNSIHHRAFTSSYSQLTNGLHFDDHFHKAHYSHLLGMRKPNVEVYLHLAKMHSLAPSETLFVDDTFKNIEGAREAGMQTLWLRSGSLVERELPSVLSNRSD